MNTVTRHVNTGMDSKWLIGAFCVKDERLGFVVKVQGHDGSNMQENALFGLVNTTSV